MRFCFHDENTETDHWIEGLTCSEAEWREAVTEGMANALEERFGIHDVSYDNSDTFVGFTSYEVDEIEIPSLMQAWREEYIRRGWLEELT